MSTGMIIWGSVNIVYLFLLTVGTLVVASQRSDKLTLGSWLITLFTASAIVWTITAMLSLS